MIEMKVYYTCDECGQIELEHVKESDCDLTDVYDYVKLCFKLKGWTRRYMAKPNAWTHYCPKCSKDLET